MQSIPIVDILGEVPSIDVEPSKIFKEKATEIREVLGNFGFMQLINHGVSNDLVKTVFSLSKQFFDKPMEAKLKYKKSVIETIETYAGYSSPGDEIFSKSLEHRETFDWLEDRTMNVDDVTGFNESINELHEQLKTLAKKVLQLLAIGLNLEDVDFFVKKNQHWVDPKKFIGLTNIRLAHYPGISEETVIPEGSVRIGEHTDYINITFLFQDDVGGLEAKNQDGLLVPVIPIPNAIVVNTGDLLEYWTKGLYKATPHRVLIPECKEKRKIARYSIAFFSGPDKDEIVTPFDIQNISSEEKNRLSKMGRIYSSEPVVAVDHVLGKVKKAYSY